MAEGKDLKIILRRSDLPIKHRQGIQDAIRVLYHRSVKSNKGNAGSSKKERWNEFATAMKTSLDDSFRPHWHVLVGTDLGYACKKLDHSLGIWNVEGTMVVIWKSPGREGPPPPPPGGEPAPAAADGQAAGTAEAAAPAAKAEPRAKVGAVKVLQPESIEEGTQVAQTVAAIKKELAEPPSSDVQVVAQSLRRRLMEELGPIWHVAVGTEFAVEAAEDCRNFVLVTAGKLRIVCFQHEQTGGRSIDVPKILKALPYLLIAIFTFAYMTLHKLCKEGHVAEGAVNSWIQRRYCKEGWDSDLTTLGAASLGLLFLFRKGTLFAWAKKKNE